MPGPLAPPGIPFGLLHLDRSGIPEEAPAEALRGPETAQEAWRVPPEAPGAPGGSEAVVA